MLRLIQFFINLFFKRMPPYLPNKIYHAGIHSFGPILISDNLKQLYFEINVEKHISSDVGWRVEIDISLDGGNSWQFLCGCSRKGGIKIDPSTCQIDKNGGLDLSTGIPYTKSTLLYIIHSVFNGKNRQIRGRLIISGGDLETSLI